MSVFEKTHAVPDVTGGEVLTIFRDNDLLDGVLGVVAGVVLLCYFKRVVHGLEFEVLTINDLDLSGVQAHEKVPVARGEFHACDKSVCSQFFFLCGSLFWSCLHMWKRPWSWRSGVVSLFLVACSRSQDRLLNRVNVASVMWFAPSQGKCVLGGEFRWYLELVVCACTWETRPWW